MSGCVVLLLVLTDPGTAVESAGFAADEAGEKILALATLRLFQKKLVDLGIFLSQVAPPLADVGGLRAPTPVGLFYILLTSALMAGRINALCLDADCAFGLLKLLQALLAAHNKLTPVDQALGWTLVGAEAVRHKSQDARDALRALFEPLRADPSLCIRLVFCIDIDHALGSSPTERNTPIVVFSGVFTWAFVSAGNNHALFKASTFGKWLYQQLVKRALHLDATRVEAECWMTLYKMMGSLADGTTPVALGFHAPPSRGRTGCGARLWGAT